MYLKKSKLICMLMAALMCVLVPLSALADTSLPEKPDVQQALALLGESIFTVTCTDDETHAGKTYGSTSFDEHSVTIGEVNVDEAGTTANVTVTFSAEKLQNLYQADTEAAHTLSKEAPLSITLVSGYDAQSASWSAWHTKDTLPAVVSAKCAEEEPAVTYSVLFKINLPNVSWEEEIKQASENDAVSPQTLPDVEGYKLLGWSTDAQADEGTQTYVVSAQDADDNGQITLFGVWEEIEKIYTITFDDNDTDIVTPDDITAKEGDEIILSDLGKNGTQYRLNGWSKDPEATEYENAYLVSGDDADENGVITLYAVTSRKPSSPTYTDDDFIYVVPTAAPDTGVLKPEVIPENKPTATQMPSSPLPEVDVPKTGDSLAEEIAYAMIGLCSAGALIAVVMYRKKHVS